jgi:hypothetical protein
MLCKYIKALISSTATASMNLGEKGNSEFVEISSVNDVEE